MIEPKINQTWVDVGGKIKFTIKKIEGEEIVGWLWAAFTKTSFPRDFLLKNFKYLKEDEVGDCFCERVCNCEKLNKDKLKSWL